MDTLNNNAIEVISELPLISMNNIIASKETEFTITFEQESTKFTDIIKMSKDASFSTVLGTVLNRLFDTNKDMKKFSNSYFKATKDVHFTIQSDTINLDTFKIQSKYDAKLRFGSSAKSQKKFAECVYHFAMKMLSEFTIVNMQELTSNLDKVDEEEQIERDYQKEVKLAKLKSEQMETERLALIALKKEEKLADEKAKEKAEKKANKATKKAPAKKENK